MHAPPPPTAFRWRLDGPTLPSLAYALPLGNALRAAVRDADARRRGVVRWPDAFHSPTEGRHDHAHFMPEDLDEDGLVDHLLLFARSGIPRELMPALCEARRVYFGRDAEWDLHPVWMGCPTEARLVGAARIWHAVTAYVTPRWRRERELPPTPETQIEWELQERGLPTPTAIAWNDWAPCSACPLRAAEFRLDGLSRRAPPEAVRRLPTLVFAEPVAGPLTLGFGAHFGLGRFVAEVMDTGTFHLL